MRPRYVFIACLLTLCGVMPAAASADETVMVCDIHGDHVAPRPSGITGISTSSKCPGNAAPAGYSRAHPPGGMAIWTVNNKVVDNRRQVAWVIDAPAGLRLSSVYIPHMYSRGINDGTGWTGGFTWAGGSRGVTTFDGELGWSSHHRQHGDAWPKSGTPVFGWRVRCSSRRCRNGGRQWLSVEFLELHVRETTEPTLVSRDGLWKSNGWIRGEWKLDVNGASPSGLCSISATLDGKLGAAHTSPRNTAVWHQCAAPPVDEFLDTAQFGQGSLSLTLRGTDAAGLTVTADRTIHVDNQRPTIALAGPTEAASTAGTQYIHAHASAGPSGVAGIACSLDFAPPHWYPSAQTAIAVRGVGLHRLVCDSENNARNAAGERGTSEVASWTLRIRAPSVSTITFDRIGSALRCAHRRERQPVPGHWSVQYRNGEKQRVWSPPRTRWVTVMQCHLRVVHRTVRRNGRWVRITTLALPRQVSRSSTRVQLRPGHDRLRLGRHSDRHGPRRSARADLHRGRRGIAALHAGRDGPHCQDRDLDGSPSCRTIEARGRGLSRSRHARTVVFGSGKRRRSRGHHAPHQPSKHPLGRHDQDQRRCPGRIYPAEGRNRVSARWVARGLGRDRLRQYKPYRPLQLPPTRSYVGKATESLPILGRDREGKPTTPTPLAAPTACA